ncbi:hypothetical protein FE782_12555 [Paenibacillus antri]|uniref:DUF3168 domain-containing protein n=1 Tax=Paenibacillus antri TaxID=2582848 RepID=A0A5R9G7Q0_9BACL|nr:hypothetical protein [Paenibacillus antri]TLS51741.1 hypothetical protein FE782_12555 [Paenibacillus antri]
MFADLEAIAAFCGELVEAQTYIGDIPETKSIPSICFPPPRIADGPGSVSSFRKTYTLAIRVVQATDSQAFLAAERIADGIRYARYRIPELDEEGNATGGYLRIDRLELQMAGTGEAELTAEWSRQPSYSRESYARINTLHVAGRLKSDGEAAE